MAVIAADIGGSKSLLGWFPQPGKARHTVRFDNHPHADFDTVLSLYLQQQSDIHPADATLVLAIAGPVQNRRQCQMTNLPWYLDAAALQTRFDFRDVILLNDLEATAWAMPGLHVTEQKSLNGRPLCFDKPVAVISVGTGLGQALLLPDAHQGWRVLPSEGGHKSFAPFDAVGATLLQQALANGQSAISWEDWFCGSGLPRLYQAMYPSATALEAAAITALAAADEESPAARCVEWLVQGLFAEAGNVALQYWSEGGVVFAGGMAQHLQPWLSQPALQQVFTWKSRHQSWLAAVPLALCTNTEAALQGAADHGWHQQIRGN